MNTKNNRRAQESRERIKHALMALLEKEDILEVTVSKLCQAAGVNRSTFYSHYDSVADIMDELLESIGKDLFSRFDNADYYQSHPLYFEHLPVILKHMQENQKFYRAYLVQSTTPHQLDWAFGQLLERFARPMMRNLQVEDTAIEYYFAFFKAGFMEVIARWLRGGCAEAPETVAGYLRNMLSHPEVGAELHRKTEL